MAKIDSADELRIWLRGKPPGFAKIISVRAALRAFPVIRLANEKWLRKNALEFMRLMFLSWVEGSSKDLLPNSDTLESDFAVIVASKAGNKFASAACYAVVNAALVFDAIDTHASEDAASDAAEDASEAVPGLWRSISADCDYLLRNIEKQGSAIPLISRRLWTGKPTRGWMKDSPAFHAKLLNINPSYDVWLKWYERRVRGEEAAFDIPGDLDRKEDKAIQNRIAKATDADFWGKGHEFVNDTLQGWLDEARARVAPVQEIETDIPPQEVSAIAYGVNAQGKLDRLPSADQVHLRDVLNQRRSYADLRAATLELLQEGQRLGPRLYPRLERFEQSLPERFQNAEAYLVWRDGIALRRLYRAHLAVALGKDPDPARLDPAVAEGLGGVLDLYNAFAFADDGIRAKDEATIPPQERPSAEAESAAAAPLVTAILAAPEIATADALDDIAADSEDADLPAGDPYVAQALDQANRAKRNFLAALVEGARNALKNPKLLGKRAVIGVASGVGFGIGKAAFGFNYAPLLEFVATNAPILQSYVSVAFSSFPSLPDLIDRITALWNRIRKG